MTNTELLYDGPDLRVYRNTGDDEASLTIQKLDSTESIQLTQEQLREILPNLQGFAASSFGDEGGY